MGNKFVLRAQTAKLTFPFCNLIPVSAAASRGLVPVEADDFAPRRGFAYRLNDQGETMMMRKPAKQQKAAWGRAFLLVAAVVLALTTLARSAAGNPSTSTTKKKIFAQILVENTLAKHPELAGLGLSTTPPRGHDCVTIADTDPKELGDKCDRGELRVMKTGQSTIEKEADGYDVTLPFHVSGKTIGIIGMDFKLDQQQAGLLNRAKAIAAEIENQIPSKSKLFEPAK